MSELSIIIATLRPRNKVQCLDVLERNQFSDYEVLLQDEDTATAARNEGIKEANTEKLVFFDDDSRPQEGYLSRVADVLDEEGAVTGLTVHPQDDVFSKHFTDHYDFGERPCYVNRFWGCNMAVRKDVFAEIGLWDEGISWGHEEIELAERILTKYPIYYDPSLVVKHPFADSIFDYWHKMYRIEQQKPYIWEKRGVPRNQQWGMIIGDILCPPNYLGFSIRHAIAQAGGNISKALGRIRGMYLLDRK